MHSRESYFERVYANQKQFSSNVAVLKLYLTEFRSLILFLYSELVNHCEMHSAILLS